ncbi:MAG TPA: polysaccharide deacetylase family protein [Candidatus Eisenbacteria bacterium]|nr:polysaccharide deacetylase family protein [Candidatus Eisenbacteria bacterium]
MAGRLAILTFHAIDDQGSPISFPPELFRRAMGRLHAAGYKTLEPKALARCLSGEAFPERSFAVTFDDGYQSVYDQAFPVLQRYGFSATVFLATGENNGVPGGRRLPSMSGRTMLSWGEIREMQRCGIEVGAHTQTHADLTRLSDARVEAEISGCRRIIEDALGAPPDSFAYPYGRYDVRVREIVRRHFARAYSDRLGLVGSKSDIFALERLDAYYLRGKALVNLLPSGLLPWYVRARNIPRQIRRVALLA